MPAGNQTRRSSGAGKVRGSSSGLKGIPRNGTAPVASQSRRGDAMEARFEPVLNMAGFTVEHVFPIGQDPSMHGVHYIVVGMAMDRGPYKPDSVGDYATWLGIDWTHHPNARDRDMGCVIQYGHYDMTEEEAFADALERIEENRGRYDWKPVPSGSGRSAASKPKPARGKAKGAGR